MAVDSAGAPIGRFDLAGGGHLTLYRGCVVDRSPSHFETLPLANVVAVRVSFERDRRKIGWGVVLLVMGLLLFAVSGPLGAFAGGAAADMAGAATQGVTRALLMLFRFFEAVASLLPALALASALGGSALGVLGWRGSTLLTLSLAGTERVYASRGQNKLLMDFSELLGERLMSLER
jgi:hypothetical protein